MNLLTKENNKVSFINLEDQKIVVCDSKHVSNLEDVYQIELVTTNTRYSKYIGKAIVDIEMLEICPFHESDKIKYGGGAFEVAEETPEMYLKEVYPKVILQDKEWMVKLLNKENESERILYEDDSFIFIPDLTMHRNDNLKHESHHAPAIHYLGIVKQKDILSLRDLTHEHIDMLRSIDKIGKSIISAKHNVPENQVRTYLHYRPSFWHLHIHFDISRTPNSFAGLDFCHLLHNVIQNLELCPNYYQKATLRILLK